MADLTANLLAFAALLRSEYAIDAGHARVYDALRAVEVAGVGSRRRFKCALRMVFCSTPGECERFERAFAAFFGDRVHPFRRPRAHAAQESDAAVAAPVQRREVHDSSESASVSAVLQARYSPHAAQTRENADFSDAGLAEALDGASRLIAALRIGRSRRWRAHVPGKRFDLRGTLRAGLQTGGDPVHLRTIGHPLRNPRVLALVDTSRSMSAHVPSLLQFAYALRRRSRRTRIFIFSTALREITRELAGVRAPERWLQTWGEAYGGGTRIGVCLAEFVRRFNCRIDSDTLVIVASDGLDSGETALVRRAMRHLHRRSAGVLWLHPHAAGEGFEPSAAGMKAALPYVSALLDARDFRSLAAAAHRLRR